jgi:hypothetical protein
MLRTFIAAAAAALMLPAAASAQPAAPDPGVQEAAVSAPDAGTAAGRRKIGFGLLFTNDFLGDGEDRWRTGSLSASHVWAPGWSGQAPAAWGELLELRLQGQIIAPSNQLVVNPADRPWAGMRSAGLHTHVQRGKAEYALGAGVVAVGPQTGLDDLQDQLHDLLSRPRPAAAVLAGQIPDTFRPLLVAEAGRSYALAPARSLRPFAALRAGDEPLLRVGADLTLGQIGRGELLVRDSVTGQRYRAVYGAAPGYSLTLGGDIAHVEESIYLPEAQYQLTHHRDRLRMGLHWQGRSASAFYGLTYLGKEFTGQRDGQVTGSIRLKLRF